MKNNNIIYRLIMMVLLAFVCFGWYTRLIAVSVSLTIAVVSITICIALNVASSNKEKRDKLLTIISLITFIVSIAVGSLKLLSIQHCTALAKSINASAQKDCCEKGLCPETISGWQVKENGAYSDSGKVNAYTFWCTIHYKAYDDRKKYSLKLRYGLDDFKYYYGGIDNCSQVH